MASRPPVGYHGTIPDIQQAFTNDPRTKLAMSALQTGMSTAPVAGGGWAIPDGLARAAQALAGAYINKKQEKKYANREQAYMEALNAAAALGQQPPANPAAVNPATVNPAAPPPPQMPVQPPMQPQPAPQAPPASPPPMQQAAAALGGVQPPMQPPPVVPPPMQPPPMQAQPILRPTHGGTGPISRGALRQQAMDYYTRGIIPNEGGTNPDGSFRISPKGAVGPAQVMPGTAAEAARLAGLPYDEKKYRSDPVYNNALGQAYYAQQLKTFGDPLKAAAAYNAGPGAVRLAIRRARRDGNDWTDHLPVTRDKKGRVVDTTKAYVARFAERIGAGGAAAPQFTEAPPQIQAPTMEAVPGGPPAPAATAPGAPQLPREVQSTRLTMAQALLQSGNPDLAQIAQTYLDSGLDEQNRARMLASEQQFQQGQTGYGANLQDWQGSRSDYRQDAYGQRRDTQQRNFGREERYANQTFEAGENYRQRTWQGAENDENRSFQGTQAGLDRSATRSNLEYSEQNANSRNDAAIQGRTDAADARTQRRNAYFNSPTGLKMQQANQQQINQNTEAIAKYQRFMDLNEKQPTGGLALNTPGIGGAYGWVDSELREMRSIANDTTLANLGGGLGAQISDSDRKFIAEANIGIGAPGETNINIARARIGALRRQNDYLQEFATAQADGNAPQFAREWAAFARSAPIVQYDKRGRAIATDSPLTFQEWRASRPRFDASGKRVK